MAQKKKKRIWLRIPIILTILAAIFFGGRFILAEKQKAALEDSYTAFTVSTGSISNSISAKGRLTLIDSATTTARASSTVSNVYVKEGDTVREGQKLMRLTSGQTVEADFDGTVNRVYFKKDDEVMRGDSLVMIADFDRQMVTVRVSEYNIGDIRPGARCYVDVTSAGKRFETTIAKVDYISEADGRVAYYTATAYIHPDAGVYPGMQATLTVPKAEVIDVPVLKDSAITRLPNGEAFVLKKNEEGAFEQVTVETGLSNENYTEIKSGLEPGDTVYAIVNKDGSTNTAGMMGMMGMGMGGMGGPGGGFGGQGGPGGNFPGGGWGGGNRGGNSGNRSGNSGNNRGGSGGNSGGNRGR